MRVSLMHLSTAIFQVSEDRCELLIFSLQLANLTILGLQLRIRGFGCNRGLRIHLEHLAT